MTSLYSDPRIALRNYGLCRSHPMAGNGTDRGCGMAGGLTASNKTRCWVFGISSEQCSLDALGGGWEWRAGADALMVLQICLAAINIRGAQKNDHTATSRPSA